MVTLHQHSRPYGKTTIVRRNAQELGVVHHGTDVSGESWAYAVNTLGQSSDLVATRGEAISFLTGEEE